MTLRAARRDKSRSGMSLIELIVASSILVLLSTMAVPLARSKVRAERERDLRAALREMRGAIDKYHELNLMGYFGPIKEGTNGWPETLDILVEGVEMKNAQGSKMRFLRKIPADPFTRTSDWGLRSDQDEADSTNWGGENVFDVYSKTYAKDSDGTPYSQW